jgi:hypothetical protein
LKKIKNMLWLFFVSASFMNGFGQIASQSNAKVVTVSQAVSNQNGFSIIVGITILGVVEN